MIIKNNEKIKKEVSGDIKLEPATSVRPQAIQTTRTYLSTGYGGAEAESNDICQILDPGASRKQKQNVFKL